MIFNWTFLPYVTEMLVLFTSFISLGLYYLLNMQVLVSLSGLWFQGLFNFSETLRYYFILISLSDAAGMLTVCASDV